MSGLDNIVELIPIALMHFGLSVSLYIILTTQESSPRYLSP